MTEAALVSVSALEQADSDDQLVQLWLFGKSENTRRAYQKDISAFFEYIGKSLREVILADLQQFYLYLATKNASRSRTLRAVKSLIAFGHRIGYLKFDVGAAFVIKREPRNIAARIIDRDQVLTMIAMEKRDRNKAMLSLLYDSGIRVGELCELRWRDIRKVEGGCGQMTIIGKGQKLRTVLISPHTVRLLEGLPNGGADSFVFTSRSGGPLDQPTIWENVRAAAKRAGVHENVSAHWLRHACASHALDAGAPIHLVQQQLGHASLETTTIYSHARPDDGLFRYLKR